MYKHVTRMDCPRRYACGQEHASQVYLNQKAVQEAIHVKLVGKSQYSFSTGLRYAKTTGSLLDEYKNTLIPNLRIMQCEYNQPVDLLLCLLRAVLHRLDFRFVWLAT